MARAKSVGQASGKDHAASAVNDNRNIRENKGLGDAGRPVFAGKIQDFGLNRTTKNRLWQLGAFFQYIADMGGRTLNVNFSDNVQEEVRAKGLVPFKRRFDDNIRDKLGRPLISVFCLDIDDKERLHAHGAVLANDNQMKTVRAAAKKAGGQITEVTRRRTQVHSSSIHHAAGWAAYISRHLRKLQNIPGQHIVYSREIHSAMRENLGLVRCAC
ncbi:MAG: hypothetical protein ACOVS5_17845 [Oligoflexus sp.]